jgi:hypothetical protein
MGRIYSMDGTKILKDIIVGNLREREKLGDQNIDGGSARGRTYNIKPLLH